MKKGFTILLILAMVLAVTACGNTAGNGNEVQSQPSSQKENASDPSGENEDDLVPSTETDAIQDESKEEEAFAVDSAQDSHILVAYFSRIGNIDFDPDVDAVTSASVNQMGDTVSGNAELLAQMVQGATGGDLFFIETTEKYPSAYRATTDLAKVEQNNKARPKLASHVENMDQYDTIVLVYPNWWGTLPMPLFTFLEEYDFSGKTVLPICTHEGSRMGSSESAIAELCPGAVLLEGLSVRGSAASSAQDEVETWIKDSGILE